MQVRRKRDIKRRNLQKMGQKLLTFVLSLCLLLGTVNTTVFAASSTDAGVAPATITADDKLADPSTMNGWKTYFKADSTEYAGAVWSDKSVFEGLDIGQVNDAQTKEDIQELGNAGVSMLSDDNFLVVLSALASTKEIEGYSTIPTDTILVLDVSQSMDNSNSIEDMIPAANSAIKTLLELNKNNRVGVILYSGNHEYGASETNTGTVLLPLDRYLANNSGRYLWYDEYVYSWQNDQGGTQVTVANGVKKESNKTNVDVITKITQGGTYIQNGLYKAWQMFDAVTDTTVTTDGDNVQEGTKRMPILVLMSDGAPTTGTESYDNIGKSTVGNGGRSSVGLGFMTQLTAAWVRTKVEAKYDNEMKFYTLGLELSREEDQTKQNVAKSVLDPENSMNAIDNIWTDFLADGTATFSSPNSTGNSSSNGDKNVTVRLSGNANDPNRITFNADSQNYVDRYFEAGSNSQLNAAFSAIVREIEIQSTYYPTLVTSGEHNLDGYLSFDDELGMFMEVKNITGLLLGDTLFSGKTLAYMMSRGEFGNASQYTDTGWELVETVSERIHVSTAKAIELLQAAWRDKQLYYERNGSAESYSNYIGWYESAAGEYVGNWLQAHTKADATAMKNAGAKYITKSYGFYGPVEEGSSIAGSNMMHVVVKVRTDIATGNQTVIFEVPASLIPMVTYSVKLNTDSLETATDIDVTMDPEDPIRLVYEAGLRSDINEFNINEIAAELKKNPVEGIHLHENSDGTYNFYTNLWGQGTNIENLAPSQHQTTEAWFEPSVENERYYYTANSTLYVQSGNGYQIYTGAQPSGNDGRQYYYPRTYFEGTNNATKKTIYVPIASATLPYVSAGENGSWYVPKGQIYRELTRFVQRGAKSENTTNTLGYFMYPVLYQPTTASDTYEIYKYHGNNGLLTFKPATGIKLTKLVDATITDTTKEYSFTIKLADVSVTGNYTLTKADGTTDTIPFANGVATVTLKANETVYITDLPAGGYTITEVESTDYKVQSVTVDGVAENGIVAENAIAVYKLDDVVFTNTEKAEGNLIVRKTVTHDLPSDLTGAINAINDKEFPVVITLMDAARNALANQTYSNGIGGTVTTNKDGEVTVRLKHNGSVTIVGIPEGAIYDVEELVNSTDMPAGFKLVTDSTGLTGTIVAKETDITTLVNHYEPTGVPANDAVEVSMTKTIVGRGWEADDEFTFHLEKMNADGSWTKVGESQTVTYDAQNTALVFDIGQLTTIGRHIYQVVEENTNSIPGITSDSARSFIITVTDTNGDGYLEIASVTGDNVAFDNNTVSMEFENKYETKGTATISIPIHKQMDNTTGVDISLSDYTFELYRTDATYIVDENASAEKTVPTNVAGEAEIHLSFNGSEFDDINATENDNNDTVTLYYLLKEQKGSATGVTYSEEAYNIQIVLEKVEVENDAVVQVKSTTITKAGEITDSVIFTNKYELTGKTSLDFPVEPTKKIEGRSTKALEADEFSFNLYETDANFVINDSTSAVATATNDASGKVSFGEIPYSKVGTYYYVITEKNAGQTIDGVAISTERYYVTVVVGTDNNKDLVVKSTTIVKPGSGIIQEDAVVFNNVYKPAPVKHILDGTKTLSTTKVFKNLEQSMFEFNLIENDVVIDTVKNNATTLNSNTASFEFKEITYTSAGEHTYTIKEVIPAEAERIAGVGYDSTEYTVKVDVKDNGEGSLVVTETISKGSSNVSEVAFTNTYTANAKTDVVLNGTKSLDGRTLKEDEFTFQLYNADQDFNHGALIASVGNAADGSIKFDFATLGIAFDESGTYRYIIKEDLTAQEMNVYYDTKEYHVTVDIFDIGGQLGAHILYELNGSPATNAAFTNIYAKPQPAELVLEATKTLNGRTLEADEFSFELYKVDNDSYVTTGKTAIQTKTNTTDGSVVFDMIYLDEIGAYYYVIKELVPADKLGIVYDTAEYKVKVVVEDRGEGYLRETIFVNGNDVTTKHQDGTINSVITFTNEYNEPNPINVIFDIVKTVTNNGDITHTRGGFEFQVKNITTNHVYESKPVSDNDGKTSFTVTYDKSDIGKTYVYEITEVNTGIQDMTYDTTVQKVEVSITYENGQLKATTILDGKAVDKVEVDFNNVYNGNTPQPDEPDDPGEEVIVSSIPADNAPTGDDSNIGLFLGISAVCLIAIIGLVVLKKFKKKDTEE